ncbi:MAG: hypothetical protein HY363_02450 [Candidatus Aenigmarchaeota archaeon]|nr:hypothetical protein [Candidatus Aenigmarchaeota archaeon]
MKGKLTLIALIIIALVGSVFAAQIPVTIERVELDDTGLSVNSVTRLDVERGKQVDVEVRLSSAQTLRNVEVEAAIKGFEFNEFERIDDVSSPFDMDANVSYVKRLQLTVPDEVDEDNYQLRISVADRDNGLLSQDFGLKIDVPRHSLQVEDVLFSPGESIKAGSSLLTSVRLENKGEKDEEDVKVTVSIPELGISASDFIDEIENEDDEEETEELFLRLPRCAKPGTYAAKIDVEFDEGHRKLSTTRPVTVLENEQCSSDNSPQLTVSVGSNFESVNAGGSVVFPFTLVNTGKTSRSFTILPSASTGAGFSSVQVLPQSTVVLEQGRAQSFQVSVQTNSNAVGTQQLFVQVRSNSNTLAEIPLSVNIAAASGWPLRRLLEIAMLGLLVLLVLIGLVIGLTKMRSEDEPQEPPEQKVY